ncbi:FdtA/QdtA family cupin domain-containing protein [Hymenobacter sp. NST-14]|uniref:sugar 3,4-ketoisomerase n=1 Tax=Hymenobacter piscis TaxID=2839984 RepID=UPI001C01730B|nr:FdtA/QdtA family cupin domain-containing protein [Hymenobacter piscis]MBT9392504.1 FdtA/QdtA family cupin domain-containing protein [Hymenobacter piscis]
MLHPYLLDFPSTGSAPLGHLVIAEGATLPFPVKRVYWTAGVPAEKISGNHAHHQLEQLIVAVHGTLELLVETPDRQKHHFVLEHPTQGLYVPPLCWREIKFGAQTVLMCLASQEYEETDYIRTYPEFEQLVSR